MLEDLLQRLATVLVLSPWGYLAALLAGLLASFSPCAVAVIPLAVGYVGGYARGDRRQVLLTALALVTGLTLAFTALGYVAGQLGYLWLAGRWGQLGLGAVIVGLGLHLSGLVSWRWPTVNPRIARRSGLGGALLLGAAMGTVASPCATPALVAILSLSATTADPWQATGLMAAYAVGHWASILVAALAAGHLPAWMEANGWGPRVARLMQVMGIVLMATGAWMISGAFL